MNYYIYKEDWYCEDCIDDIKEFDLLEEDKDPASKDYPKGPYLSEENKSNKPEHCSACYLFLQNPLTLEGKLYLEEELASFLVAQAGKYKDMIQLFDFYRTDLNYYRLLCKCFDIAESEVI